MVLVGWWNQKGEGVESEGSGDRVIMEFLRRFERRVNQAGRFSIFAQILSF
jgi:hypothetical protein